MKKRFTTPILFFVESEQMAVEMVETTPGSRALLDKSGTLASRLFMVDHANGDFETLFATPRWIEGWRAPVGTVVKFSDEFPEELKEQALARVPAIKIKFI